MTPLPELGPWFEVLNAGQPSTPTTSAIIAGYQYTQFTTPREFDQTLLSAFANFDDTEIFFKLQSSEQPKPLTNLMPVGTPAIFGKRSDWFQQMRLPMPFVLPAFEQMQLQITSRSAVNLSQTQVIFKSTRNY